MMDMHCRDSGMECGFVAQGETEADVVRMATAHAFDAHGLRSTPELEQAIASLTHDVESEEHRRSTSRVAPHVSSP